MIVESVKYSNIFTEWAAHTCWWGGRSRWQGPQWGASLNAKAAGLWEWIIYRLKHITFGQGLG
jgi:hypothetical protein